MRVLAMDNTQKRRQPGEGMLDTTPPPAGADSASQLAPDELQTSHGAEEDQKTKTRLTAPEREVVLTIADDEETWHVYTDSVRLTGLLLRFARRHGIPVKQPGGAYEFDLPRNAVRFQMRRGRQQLR
jgi:hypothetical protein